MNMINAVLIDPEARSVTAITLDADADQLPQLYALIGCDLVEVISLPDDDTGWVDEEGLLKPGALHFFELPTYPQPLCGKCVITGTMWNDEGDVMVSAKATVDSILAQIAWASREELIERYAEQ